VPIITDLQKDTLEAGAEALLVTTPANVRYLSGFTSPEDGVVVVLPDRAVLVTDGRYIAQAAEESRLEVEIARPWHDWVIGTLAGKTLAVEAEHMAIARFNQLTSRLGKEPVLVKGLVERHRLLKTDLELKHVIRAAEITDAAFDHILEFLKPGCQEVEIALELERFMRQAGANIGFEIIVASGPRSAMPHGLASRRIMQPGELVTLDFGAEISGYHADMTRTVSLGEPSEQHRAIYEQVLEVQLASLKAVGPGVSCAHLDHVARNCFEHQGFANQFAHSLGHGVGLEIHEAPMLSQRSDDILEAGMVVTVEPGVYFPGNVGVRIEDLLVITESSADILSKSEKNLLEL
jgi:Xaa-Pro aminopeptidase